MGNCAGIQSLKDASCVSEIVKVIIIPARVNTQAPERWKGKWMLPPCQQPPVASAPPREKLLRHFLALAAGNSPCPRDGPQFLGSAAICLCPLPHPPPRAWGGLHLPQAPRAVLKMPPQLVLRSSSADQPRVAWALVDHLIFSCRMLLSLWKAKFVFHLQKSRDGPQKTGQGLGLRASRTRLGMQLKSGLRFKDGNPVTPAAK